MSVSLLSAFAALLSFIRWAVDHVAAIAGTRKAQQHAREQSRSEALGKLARAITARQHVRDSVSGDGGHERLRHAPYRRERD